jgi:hypothetical protein
MVLNGKGALGQVAMGNQSEAIGQNLMATTLHSRAQGARLSI